MLHINKSILNPLVKLLESSGTNLNENLVDPQYNIYYMCKDHGQKHGLACYSLAF